MTVDEARQHGAAAAIDHLGMRGESAHVGGRAGGRDAAVPNGERLHKNTVAFHGGDLAIDDDLLDGSALGHEALLFFFVLRVAGPLVLRG